MTRPASNPSDFVASLDRGLQVLTCLGNPPLKQTLTQVAKTTGLSRGTARRFLLTLQTLNYVSGDGKLFWLTPKVLQFSNGFLTNNGIAEAARFVLPDLSDKVGENVSIAVLDEADVVYLSRHEISRIFSTGLDVGSRVPAYCSSLGRVLLADLPPPGLERFLMLAPFPALTDKTVVDTAGLRACIDEVRHQGFAIVDGELEPGLRSIAMPVRDPNGKAIAAVNISTSTARTPMAKFRKEFVPALRLAVAEIEANLGKWLALPQNR
jgi:IclR family pca regulon transcriptional regulator